MESDKYKQVHLSFASVSLDIYKTLMENTNALLMNCLEGFRDSYRVVIVRRYGEHTDLRCLCVCEGIDKENRDKTLQVIIPIELAYYYKLGDVIDQKDLVVL